MILYKVKHLYLHKHCRLYSYRSYIRQPIVHVKHTPLALWIYLPVPLYESHVCTCGSNILHIWSNNRLIKKSLRALCTYTTPWVKIYRLVVLCISKSPVIFACLRLLFMCQLLAGFKRLFSVIESSYVCVYVPNIILILLNKSSTF